MRAPLSMGQKASAATKKRIFFGPKQTVLNRAARVLTCEPAQSVPSEVQSVSEWYVKITDC
jgi:hypothetical protein